MLRLICWICPELVHIKLTTHIIILIIWSNWYILSLNSQKFPRGSFNSVTNCQSKLFPNTDKHKKNNISRISYFTVSCKLIRVTRLMYYYRWGFLIKKILFDLSGYKFLGFSENAYFGLPRNTLIAIYGDAFFYVHRNRVLYRWVNSRTLQLSSC